jgi:hypothetical protein
MRGNNLLKVTLVKMTRRAAPHRRSLVPGGQEVYCSVSVGVGFSYKRLGRHKLEVFSPEAIDKIHYPDITLWDGPLEHSPYLEFSFWDSTEGATQYVDEDFLGSFQITVNPTDHDLVITAARGDSVYEGQTAAGDHIFFMRASDAEYTIHVRVESY